MHTLLPKPILCCVVASLFVGAASPALFGAEPGAPATPPPDAARILITSELPADIPGGAEHATLDTAARFAWQEFVALNWPAKAGERDVPDNALPFGNQAGPLVWQTYRAKSEIYPGSGSATVKPHGYNPQDPHLGYDAPPEYDYNPSKAKVEPGSAKVGTTPWVNLDEISEIGLNMMYAGVVPNAKGPNTEPKLIRFMAKANRTEYEYAVRNEFWYDSDQLKKAQAAYVEAITTGKVPTGNVSFPNDTVEVKSAWRQLGPNEDRSRFHMAPARFYEEQPPKLLGEKPTYLYYDEPWALIALHIIHKTPSGQAFVWATFEQADNILNEGPAGKPVPVEDADGKIINQPKATSTTPTLTYKDAPPEPSPSKDFPRVYRHGEFVADPGPRLFYVNTSADPFNGEHKGLPAGGNIQINYRDHAIPTDIQKVNTEAHTAIAAYSKSKGVSSPWAYYKLVNVQAFPFDYKDRNLQDPNSPHGDPTFHLANSVVETDYTLQNYSGRISHDSGAPTNYPPAPTPTPVPSVPPTSVNTPPNVILYRQQPVQKSNMGGCMGCHGNAQAEGSDFSFILGASVSAPEAPNGTKNPTLLGLKAYLSTGRGMPPSQP